MTNKAKVAYYNDNDSIAIIEEGVNSRSSTSINISAISYQSITSIPSTSSKSKQ